ncbi:protein PAL OF QUIRKY [Malania oleifera]|uniref:protein PAL OF QUIRKY n=1 Tax=Malania oleifera TaxID=397392 RepID=UPI0025ADFF25|nr:protein PAL OF QUIRKY [Malania oleifera]
MVAIEESKKDSGTIKFLYSYGGQIRPRSTDGKLRYVGGHTRVLNVGRSISFAELLVKLGELCGSSVSLRCKLPTEDLDTLVSVTSDEDLANLIEEYDRAAASSSSGVPLKIIAILSPPKSLKVVSPPASAASVFDHRPLKAPPSYPLAKQTCSPPVGFPIAIQNQNGAVGVPHHPPFARGSPYLGSPYFWPYWNRMQL